MIERIRDNLNPRHSFLRLDCNERFLNFPCFREMLATITQDDIMAYPEPMPLYEKLAEYHNVSIKNIYLASGSDTVIKTFFETFISQNNKVVSSEPCFPMYKVYCDLFNARFVGIEYDEKYRFKYYDLLESLSNQKHIGLVVLANPNSPIGNYLTIDKIEKLVKYNIPVMIDEAYIDFSNNKSCFELIQYENIGIVRTFSKAFGLAGLRIGYALGHENLIERLFQWRAMEEVNQLGIKIACYLLDHIDIVTDYCEECKTERTCLMNLFETRGFDVIGSDAGWIHINHKSTKKQKQLISNLEHRNCLLKLVSLPFDSRKNWIRLSLGPNLTKLIEDLL